MILGMHQGRMIALIDDQPFAATDSELKDALLDLTVHGHTTVRVSGTQLSKADLLAFLIVLRFKVIDHLPELPNCQPWGARDSCDEAGIFDNQGRLVCAQHQEE